MTTATETEAYEHPAFTKAKSLPEPLRGMFPKSPEEVDGWQPTIQVRALASTVLVVARTRVECAWAAYIMGVPGHSHEDEWGEVLSCGDKLPQEVAVVLFPALKEIPYAR
jgi:predicted amidohydrolase